ncbi:MAG: hypothetical protein AABY53_09585 [Bdellovibrionota bacterium]
MRLGVKVAAAASLTVLLVMNFSQGCSKSRNKTSGSSTASSSSASKSSCATPAGFSGSPKTIEEAIAMINALPKPVTVGCFLESLKRPLGVTMTSSLISAQPANIGDNLRNPRVFILGDPLTISIVPAGVGSEVIEFGVMVGDSSIKGELAFPVIEKLLPTAAYDKIRFGNGTACQVCHKNETRALEITQGEAFRSGAIRPKPETKVALESIKLEWLSCDKIVEPKRCEILRGLFDHGEVRDKEFPPELPTISFN